MLTSTTFVLLSSAHPFRLFKFESSSSSSSSSSSLNVQPVADPVVIDPAGIYIRASPLQNGGIIAGYAALEGTQKILRVSQSLDNATSWTPLGEVTRANDLTTDLDNAMPLQLPSGRIVLAFRNHDRGSDPESYTHYRISLCYSDDGGKSWGFLSQIVEREADLSGRKNGLWEPFLRLAKDGSLQCFYSSENDDNDQDNFVVVSKDGGVTWSSDDPVLVSGGESTDTRDGMTGVAEVDGKGTLICVFESVHKGIFSIHRTLSHNDGLTWGERSLVYTAANGKDAGAPQVYNVGGTLVTSFMTNEELDLPQLDGGQMKVVTSINGAADWSSMSQDGTVTGGVGSHWPGLYTLDDRRFLALYSKAGIGAVSRVYRIA
ncbi:glycoside hydrolase [Rhypophila decipiens]|uniref:Glycoside hydrolase n=1 Tax=Rhypophila decipiens TaxID=261697 RepID=A0AAN6XY10_9PEZI|nr:glycoside hydrolase [Rhypophila decipiens]